MIRFLYYYKLILVIIQIFSYSIWHHSCISGADHIVFLTSAHITHVIFLMLCDPAVHLWQLTAQMFISVKIWDEVSLQWAILNPTTLPLQAQTSKKWYSGYMKSMCICTEHSVEMLAVYKTIKGDLYLSLLAHIHLGDVFFDCNPFLSDVIYTTRRRL